MIDIDYKIGQHFDKIGGGFIFTIVESDAPKQIYTLDITIVFWSINILINARFP